MIKTHYLNSKTVYYYDLEEKCIARFPSNSNLLVSGSDNSLYFGSKSNDAVCDIFCNLFDADNIDEINGNMFKMKCINEKVNVVTNINKEGQVQIKIMKNGSMYKLASNYSLMNMENYDFTKMLIVIDFKNNEIRFKDPKELKL